MNTQNKRLLKTITLVRLAAALLLPIYPVWAMFLVFVFDWVDSYVIIHHYGVSRHIYQRWDKRVDWYSQSIMALMLLYSGYFMWAILSVIIRLAGHMLFEKTGNRNFFILFPNIVEPIFAWYIVLPQFGISPLPNVFYVYGVWLFIAIKFAQEIIVHLGSPIVLHLIRKAGGYPVWMKRLGFHNMS